MRFAAGHVSAVNQPPSYYYPKMYTHWRELEHMRDQIKREYDAAVRANQLQQDYSPIVVYTKEVDGILKKAMISFKVVE